MRELNVNEIKVVSGGVGSLIVFGFMGARAIFNAYRTNAAFRSTVNAAGHWVAAAIGGGYFFEKAKELSEATKDD